MMKKVKIIFNHFVDELKTDLLSVKDELKTDLLTLKDKLKTSLLTLKEEARSPSTKNNVRLLGVFLCILGMNFLFLSAPFRGFRGKNT